MSFESGDTWEVVCPNHDWGDRDGEGVRVAGDVGLYVEAELEYDYDTKEWFVTDKAKEEARQRAIQIWNTRAERTCHAVFDDSNWYKWICSECGQPIDRADNYCFSCGAKVVG